MRHFVIRLIIIASMLLTPACSLTETQMITFSSRCDHDEVLRQVDELLVDYTFESHYTIINKEWVLSIWLVDSELDPSASGDDIAENSTQAFIHGAMIAHKVAYQIPCARELFDGINPMIVDRNYNGWYIDIIPMRALPLIENPSVEALTASIERSGMEYADVRRTSTQDEIQIAQPDACTWPEARAAIRGIIDPEQRNNAAYLIINHEQVLAQVQWAIAKGEGADDKAVAERIGLLSKALDCLTPPIDTMEVFVVDARGRLNVYGRVSGEVIRSWDSTPSPENRIRLHHVPKWLLIQ
ncbi:hypothetical protein ACFLXQ_00765 [Chloroflexota bacterium]